MTNRLAQLLELIESPCQITVTAPPQLSLVITLLVSGAGTWLAQLTVRLVGQVSRGGHVCTPVTLWARVPPFACKKNPPAVGRETKPRAQRSPTLARPSPAS